MRIQVLEGQNNKLHRTISKLAVCRRQEAGCSRGNGRSEEEVGEPSADWLVQKVVWISYFRYIAFAPRLL